MLSNDLSITYDAASKSLVRVNQDNYGAVYRGEDGNNEFQFTVKHTIPARGKFGESHMARLDLLTRDSNMLYTGTPAVWLVAKSFDMVQDSTVLKKLVAAMLGFLPSDSGNTVSVIDRIVGRES